MRISDWSSDVGSSDILMICEFFDPNLEFQENQLVKYYRKAGHEVLLLTSTFESVFDSYGDRHDKAKPAYRFEVTGATVQRLPYKCNIKIGRASCRERVCPYV